MSTEQGDHTFQKRKHRLSCQIAGVLAQDAPWTTPYNVKQAMQKTQRSWVRSAFLFASWAEALAWRSKTVEINSWGLVYISSKQIFLIFDTARSVEVVEDVAFPFVGFADKPMGMSYTKFVQCKCFAGQAGTVRAYGNHIIAIVFGPMWSDGLSRNRRISSRKVSQQRLMGWFGSTFIFYVAGVSG